MKKRSVLIGLLLFSFGLYGQVQIKNKSSLEELKRELTAKKKSREKQVKMLEKQKLTFKREDISTRKVGDVKKSIVEVDSTKNGNLLHFKGLNKFNAPEFYQTNNYGGAVATGIDLLRNGTAKTSYYGEGFTIGKWDGGTAYLKHQDFGDRVYNMDKGSQVMHATHVAGTMIGDGSLSGKMSIENTMGMAPKASLKSYDWIDDELEMIEEGSKGMNISNHSYGFSAGVVEADGSYLFLGNEDEDEDYHFGFYGEHDAFRDEIAFNLPHYLTIWAAGNSGNDPGLPEGVPHYVWNGTEYVVSTKERKASCWNGYDCIATGSNAKNILTVGAILKTTYNADSSDYMVASFSAKGPTDDGRVKPDIVAPGTSIVSTSVDGGYARQNGTSMATPIVTGGVTLIQESAQKHLKKQLQASTVKALIINTAREAGNKGPDYQFGWGVFDAFESIKIVENNGKTGLIEELTLNTNETKNLYLTASGTEPLKVTIAWTDVPGVPNDNPTLNDRTRKLVNDLDIRIYDEANQLYLPWKLDPNNPKQLATKGDNNIDNVEQIVIENAKKNKVYRVQISHKGDLMYGGQNFSLVASGLKARKKNDLAIVKLESKKDQKSYDTPGVYLILESEKKKILNNVQIEYVLKNSRQEEVLKKKKKINFDPSSPDPIFLALEKKEFRPNTKDKYTVEVTVKHQKDTEVRNNKSSLDYYYFVERIQTDQDLYYQNFFNYNVSLYEEGLLNSDRMNFGWEGNASTVFSLAKRTKGISFQMRDDQGKVKTNPFYLVSNEEYLMSIWVQSHEDEGKIENMAFNVREAFTDELIKTVNLENTQGSGFVNVKNTFSLDKEGYVYLEFINPKGDVIELDDFSLAFNNSKALIVDYKVGAPLNKTGSAFSLTKVAWNQFTPQLYDQTYTKIVADSTHHYSWNVSGSEHVFEENTDQNSIEPKIRLINPNRFINVTLTVNNTLKSSTEHDLKTEEAFFDFYYLDLVDHYDLRSNSIDGNTYENAEGKNYTLFRNNFAGVRKGPTSGNPYQNSLTETDFLFFKSSFEMNDMEGVDDMSRGRFESYRFKNPGEFTLSLRTKDSNADGKYFNEVVPLHHYKVLDQFQPISNLVLKEKNKKYNLQWKNPPFYHFEVMTFDTDYENYIKVDQFKGASKLGWRLHNEDPILSFNGAYSMVSESIDEETMTHQDIDNWFYTSKKNRAAAKYFSFLASMADDYREDRYEVYLLDASKIAQPENPTVNDFRSHGVLVKTEEMTGMDKELDVANYTFLKTVDLEKLNLMNKDVYVAFRHHTKALDRGSFLSIDLLKFHNVLDEEIDLNYRFNNLFQTAGKTDIGWKSLNMHVYPIKGYEIAEIDKNGDRTVISTIENKIKDSFTFNKNKVSQTAEKLGVTLLYDTSSQVDGSIYNQAELDVPELKELTVDLKKSNTGNNGGSVVEKLALYPVPVKNGDLYFKVEGTYEGKVEYQIFGLFGFKRMEGHFKKKEQKIDKKVQVHRLFPGIYFVRIKMGEKIFYRKFFKL
ncbi:MAG: S8 family serine peptidase [Flavobacteriales bacterium]